MFTIIHLAIGIFLGWFFLPRPAWADALVEKLVKKIPFLAPFVKK